MTANGMVDVMLEVKSTTDFAVRVSNGSVELWLPRSQLKHDTGLEVGNWYRLSMPAWLAESKGLI